jgi:alkyl hydroperoxide reductase subunit D
MNNIYYRFIHLASNDAYVTKRAGLRMNANRTHGVSQADFELRSLAVSAINGCGSCIDFHEKVVREKGLSEAAVQAAVRIASILHAVARVLDAEQAPAAA